jgi:glycosyltransferase involved in cell wall biosynthesis
LGDGPERENLIKEAQGSSVQLLGWKDYEELPLWYHRASLFILPSYFEPWGLVVNEAMAAGLPILVSSATGCHPDLISEANGWIFDPKDEEKLVILLNHIASIPDVVLKRMGQESSKQIRNFSLEKWAYEFDSCLKC